MNNFCKLALAICAIAGTTQAAFAAAQDLTTWNQSGVSVGFTGTTGATLVSGDDQSVTSTAAFGGTDGTILSKDFTLGAGSTVSFQWDFSTNDYVPFYDFADVVIGSHVFTLANVGTVGSYGNSDWQSFSYTLGSAMTGPIEFVVSNYADNSVSSTLNIKGVTVSPVPESTNLALMMAGMGLLGVVARRRKA